MSDQIYQLVKESGAHAEAIKNEHELYLALRREFEAYVKTHAEDGKSKAHLLISLIALIVSMAGFVVTLIFNMMKLKP